MKFYDDPETDSLHIELQARPDVDTREVTPGIDHASCRLDLYTLETTALPVTRAA